MRNPGGYAIWTTPDGPAIEKDTFTCCHCNRVVFLDPKLSAVDQGGFCMRCFKNICGPCADHGACRPFEEWLLAKERDITARVERDRELERLLKVKG